MDFLKTFTEAPASSSSSPFLNMLPLEIRREIYGYLVGSHTKREHDMNSAEYNNNRSSILAGPDHSYRFHPSILGANQQTRKEAMDVFLKENTLVSLEYDVSRGSHPIFEEPEPGEASADAYPYWEELDPRNNFTSGRLQACGVAVITETRAVETCPFVGMSIELDSHLGRAYTRMALFMVDDLPAACVSIQRKIDDAIERLGHPHLIFKISPEIERVAYLGDRAWPVPGSQYSKCLAPLGQFRGVSKVSVFEERDACYTATLGIGGPQLSAKESMDLVVVIGDQAHQHRLDGSFTSAIDGWQTALRTIQRGAFKEDDLNEQMVGGHFDGLSAGQARDNAIVELHGEIALCFLEIGESRLARIYVERIYGPLGTSDNRGNPQKFPLRITTGDHTAYAWLLWVAAEISLEMGDYPGACEELSYASSLDPLNLKISQRLEECETLWAARYKRREAKQDQQRNSLLKREREATEVAHLRKVKADRAVRAENLPLALEKYEAAYRKTEGLYLCDWDFHLDWRDLRAEIASKLIAVALELQDHETVHRWADLNIGQASRFVDLDEYLWTAEIGYYEPVSYRREALKIAHYGKAATFQKQGKITAAIQEFKNALECNGDCHASYYQHEFLKQMETEEDRLQYRKDQQLDEERKAREREMEEREAEEREAEEREAEEREAADDEDEEDD